MTKEEIQEGNKLIAEFMNQNNVGQVQKWDYDWNWSCLMPAVEKIENLGFDIRIMRYGSETTYTLCDIVGEENLEIACNSFESKIKSVYKTVIDFINWYNNTQTK